MTTLGQQRSQLHQLNETHPFAEPLKALFASELAHWEALARELRETLAGFRPVKAAWLYGSAARGDDRPGSDVDIAIAVEGDVGRTTDAVREAMHTLEDRYQASISVVALSPIDILARADDDPWWAEVVRDGLALKAEAPQRYVSQLRRSAVGACRGSARARP